jgi:hypothetical chaperone protein
LNQLLERPARRTTAKARPPVLGIDFGTSNSAAAWIDTLGGLQEVPLAGGRAEMPTALFFASETQTVLYGAEAMQAYLAGTEGRLLRSLKSLLGSRLMDEYTAVNGQSLRFYDILVLFFKELKRRCEVHAGQPLTHAVLGRPVHFVDDDSARDAQAQATLERAARDAGFTHLSCQLEPIAAALDYEQRVQGETTALVVDIGGGTSDFTVIRLNPARSQRRDRRTDILATTGIHLGGTDFDRLLDLAVVMPLLGYRHQGVGGRPVPNSVFFDLATWHLIHQAYTRRALHFAAELRPSYADPVLHQRLMQVLDGQHGHRLLSAVETAKIACSESGRLAPIDLTCLGAGLTAGIDTGRLQEALQASVAEVVQCAQACVSAAGRTSVDVVYLTGGSSALRPLVEALQTAMPQAQLVEGNRFGGVAAGLAHAGAAVGR